MSAWKWTYIFKVEVHSSDPGLTVLFSSGSTENTIYIPWRNLWCGVTSQVIGERGISSAGWLKKIILLGVHKKGRGTSREAEDHFKFCCGSLIRLKPFWGKAEFPATACFQGLHYTFQTPAERWFKLAYMQGSIQKNPQNSHDYCDKPPWKMLFGNFCCSRAKHELSVPSTKLKIKQSPLPKNLQSSWELRLIHRRNHETL